jgi:hypothetical protein
VCMSVIISIKNFNITFITEYMNSDLSARQCPCQVPVHEPIRPVILTHISLFSLKINFWNLKNRSISSSLWHCKKMSP